MTIAHICMHPQVFNDFNNDMFSQHTEVMKQRSIASYVAEHGASLLVRWGYALC